VKEGKRVVVPVLPVLGEAATSIEPADGALDDPALRLDDKTLRVVATPDDLGHQVGHDVGDAAGKDRPGIGAVGEQLAQEGELSEQGGQQQHAAVAILHVGGGDQGVQHEAELVDQDVALLALDQLAGVEAMRIDRRPPFSALFTLWLSMMQAVGLASRAACSRHFTKSA
jgi:hypothetical protein